MMAFNGEMPSKATLIQKQLTLEGCLGALGLGGEADETLRLLASLI